MAVGLFLVRWRRNKLALGRSEFRAWDAVVVFNVVANLYILIMPWYPPQKGGADVSFWYGTYVVVGIAMLVFLFFLCLPPPLYFLSRAQNRHTIQLHSNY